jgi:hypothetical protein
VGGRHTYNVVLPRTPKGSFVTLILPLQYHAAFGMMAHTLGSANQALFAILGHPPPLLRGYLGLNFGGVCLKLICVLCNKFRNKLISILLYTQLHALEGTCEDHIH